MARPLCVCVLLACLALLATVSGCPPTTALPPPVTVADQWLAQYVVDGAEHPMALAFSGDGRVFYTEKNTGKIRVVAGGVLRDEPVAEVPVNFAGDRGLLGIAAHPDFLRNGRLYVFYTLADNGQVTDNPVAVLDNRIVYFDTVDSTAVGGEVFVASLPAGAGVHHVSGRLAFGADGKLYAAIGDLDEPEAAQTETLAGKILRMNDDGTVPADNPTAGSYVYAYGVRDVRGLAVDPVSKVLYGLDRNDTKGEEINRYLPGHDYGWPNVAGTARTATELQYAAEHPAYLDPILETTDYFPGLVGGSFDPSTRYNGASLLDDFFYGAAVRQQVLRLELDPGRTLVAGGDVFGQNLPGEMTDVAFTPAGTLYVATDTALFRIIASR